MTQRSDAIDPQDTLRFEYQLDAPLARVWRAVTIPAYVERWLAPLGEPAGEGAAPAESLRLIDAEHERSARYAWREEGRPDLDNIVTFRLHPNESGGTTFVITHELIAAPAISATPPPANSNRPKLLLAA